MLNALFEVPQVIKKNVDIKVKHDTQSCCIIFTLQTEYEGIQNPTLTLDIHTQDGESIYLSHEYTVGQSGKCVENEWRIPPILYPGLECTVHVCVPDGLVLKVLKCSVRYEAVTKKSSSDVEFDAHLGFFGVAPENTMHAIKQAAICGFNSCIVVPKLTKDGIFVCIHDDTINRTARDQNGNPPKEPMKVCDMTYEELLQWDFGWYKSSVFKGTKIPKLEDFFRVCAEYGMKPIFSVHPDFSIEEWLQIRSMLERYDLLKLFKVKNSNINVLKNIYQAFGNDINGYILWSKAYSDELISKLKELPIDLDKTHGIIEIVERLDEPMLTKEAVNEIKAAGYQASVISCWGRKTGDYYKRLLSYGVGEFTEDYHCSFDLNW